MSSRTALVRVVQLAHATLPRAVIVLNPRIVGKGSFGEVYKGYVRGLD